jgi:hypothetical protein
MRKARIDAHDHDSNRAALSTLRMVGIILGWSHGASSPSRASGGSALQSLSHWRLVGASQWSALTPEPAIGSETRGVQVWEIGNIFAVAPVVGFSGAGSFSSLTAWLQLTRAPCAIIE